MEFFYSIVGFFMTGGPFMYPILLVFAVGAALAIERYVTLTTVTAKNQSAWSRVQPVLMNGNFDEAREMTSKDDSTISQLLGMGLARQGAVRRRQDIEIAMEEGMMEIIPQLEKRTPYVVLASSIATLLGLLGTIVGLIEAFAALENAPPEDRQRLLAGGIALAMNTTAFGLVVAIPTMLAHLFLSGISKRIVDEIDQYSVKLENLLVAHSKGGGAE